MLAPHTDCGGVNVVASAIGGDSRHMANAVCVLCDRVDAGALVLAGGSAAALDDAFPVSTGHTLVVPRRHQANLLDLLPIELADLWMLVIRVCAHLGETHRPAGFNIGANIGAAAGQTVDHGHVHVIPRYEGDVSDPRGGVRWVLPHRAAYWAD